MFYNNSKRYGAEEKDVFNPTFMEGLAAHRECRYVVASRVPVRPHGQLRAPIVVLLSYFFSPKSSKL